MPWWVAELLFNPAWATAFWGICASAAAIVACCGPSRTARICAIYLLVGWAVSNFLHLHFDYFGRRQGFAIMDGVGGAAIFIVWMARPRAWIGVIVASTIAQLILHVFAISAPANMHWGLDLANNVLYGIQLAANCTPTFMKERRGPWPLETARWRPRGPRPPRGTLAVEPQAWPKKGIDY